MQKINTSHHTRKPTHFPQIHQPSNIVIIWFSQVLIRKNLNRSPKNFLTHSILVLSPMGTYSSTISTATPQAIKGRDVGLTKLHCQKHEGRLLHN